jgi:hypothetical protein
MLVRPVPDISTGPAERLSVLPRCSAADMDQSLASFDRIIKAMLQAHVSLTGIASLRQEGLRVL